MIYNYFKTAKSQVLRSYIGKNIDINHLDTPNGNSPLHWAAISDDIIIAKQLIRDGARVNLSGSIHKNTPLHVAVMGRRVEFASLLIENNADVNAQNSLGRTPLHHAVIFCAPKLIKVLLDNRADINIEDNCGMTPLQLAISLGYHELVDLLRPKVRNSLQRKNEDIALVTETLEKYTAILSEEIKRQESPPEGTVEQQNPSSFFVLQDTIHHNLESDGKLDNKEPSIADVEDIKKERTVATALLTALKEDPSTLPVPIVEKDEFSFTLKNIYQYICQILGIAETHSDVKNKTAKLSPVLANDSPIRSPQKVKEKVLSAEEKALSTAEEDNPMRAKSLAKISRTFRE